MDQGRATRWSRAKHIPSSFLLFCSLLPDASSTPFPYTTKCKDDYLPSQASPVLRGKYVLMVIVPPGPLRRNIAHLY